LSDGSLLLDVVELKSVHELVMTELVLFLGDPEVPVVGLQLFRLDLMLLLDVFQRFFDVLLQIGLLVLVLELQMLDFLFHLIQLHDVVLLELLDLRNLVELLRLSFLEELLLDDPVEIDLLTFLLELGDERDLPGNSLPLLRDLDLQRGLKT
jgi:hypothetical protein